MIRVRLGRGYISGSRRPSVSAEERAVEREGGLLRLKEAYDSIVHYFAGEYHLLVEAR